MSETLSEIQNNLYAFYDQVAQCKGIYAERQNCWSVIKNNPGNWPRIIYRVSPDISIQESSTELIDKVQAGIYPEVLITTNNNIEQNNTFLRNNGFFPFMGWKGMAMELTGDIIPPEIPESVEIVTMAHPQDSEQWIRIVSNELITPNHFDKTLLDTLITRPGVEVYLLKYRGTGVSTLLVFTTEYSTGFYFLATDQSAQRKGFAQLLFQQIIWQIAQKSKKPIILHATQKGEGLYTKLGFQPYNQFFLYRFLHPQP